MHRPLRNFQRARTLDPSSAWEPKLVDLGRLSFRCSRRRCQEEEGCLMLWWEGHFQVSECCEDYIFAPPLWVWVWVRAPRNAKQRPGECTRCVEFGDLTKSQFSVSQSQLWWPASWQNEQKAFRSLVTLIKLWSAALVITILPSVDGCSANRSTQLPSGMPQSSLLAA